MKKRLLPEPPAPRTVIVDPAMVGPRPEPRQEEEAVWHHEVVGQRLIEAAATVRRMPMNIWPKQYGTIWPHYNPMTPAEMQAFKNDLLQSGGQGALDAWHREQNRIRIPPSGREIERCEQALGWICKYLHDDSETAGIVGYWASRTYDPDEEAPGPVRIGLREIARGLRHDRVPVRP